MVVGDIPTGTDVLVIGGGPSGYVAAIRAGQLDLDVTLVEATAIGGTCLNAGCIPSKAFIAAADLAYRTGTAGEMGISADPTVDFGAMVAWKDGVVERLTDGVEQRCRAEGVTLVDGRAEFAGSHRARVVHGGAGEGAESVEFDHAVVATGSHPIPIPGFDFEDEPVLDAAEALSLDVRPDRLVVVGAGYIGMELSTAFTKLGTDVTVVEQLDAVLPGYDDALVRPVERRAAELGIDLQLEQSAVDWYPAADGIDVVTEGDGDQRSYRADAVLVAVGRAPTTDALELEAVGLEPDDRGFLPTDDQGRTAVEHVFAVGDVAGEPLLAHTGMVEGEIAAAAITGHRVGVDHQAVPVAVFTDPEIGTVGLTPDAAEAAGFEPAVGRCPFAANGRAMTTGRTDGFVRLVADADRGFVLGGQVVGGEASELVAEIGFAIEMGATLEDLAATVHAHPTLAEAVREAAMQAEGRAVHTANRSTGDRTDR